MVRDLGESRASEGHSVLALSVLYGGVLVSQCRDRVRPRRAGFGLSIVSSIQGRPRVFRRLFLIELDSASASLMEDARLLIESNEIESGADR